MYIIVRLILEILTLSHMHELDLVMPRKESINAMAEDLIFETNKRLQFAKRNLFNSIT
jgi:hypothetical protein